MISNPYFSTVKKTWHYIKEHEKEVPFDVVAEIVVTGRRKLYKNGIIKFETKSFYVLGTFEGDILKIINAKRK